MGNRMIKDSLLVSNKISGLSDFDFRLWIVLILLADDYGVADARPEIIKGHGYPLRERIAVRDIERSLQRLAAARCVSLYSVDGMPYAQFPQWSQHQRLRDSKHKYPTIDQADTVCGESPQVAASCRKLRPETELEENIYSSSPRRDEGEILDKFAEFYSAYPRKVSKQAALKAWKALKPDDDLAGVILADVQRRCEGEWSGKDKQYIPHPSTYLNQRRWEDETDSQDIPFMPSWDEMTSEEQETALKSGPFGRFY